MESGFLLCVSLVEDCVFKRLDDLDQDQNDDFGGSGMNLVSKVGWNCGKSKNNHSCQVVCFLALNIYR